MNWLITGGCGFIGTALIARLVSEGGHNIRVVDNLSVGTREDLSKVTQFQELGLYELPMGFGGVQLLVADILDAEMAVAAAAGCHTIIHFAANTGVGPSVANPRGDMMANVIGTFNYLEAARVHKIPRFVFASSGAPIGEVDPPLHEELAPHPVSPYGASKLAGEGYCSAYNRTFGVGTVTLRFGNVYGPGSLKKASVVAKFIRHALAGGVLEIYGDGKQTRDFIYIDDLIEAVLLAAAAPSVDGEVFQIASNRETTIFEMAGHIIGQLSAAGVNDVRLVNTECRQGDVRRNYSDTTKAKKLLGWQPKVSLSEGLNLTINHFIHSRRT
jgi:UDP-glucose 4-epimerase